MRPLAYATARPPASSPSGGRLHVFTGPDRHLGLNELLDAVLHDPRASHRILYLSGGEQPVDEAFESVF